MSTGWSWYIIALAALNLLGVAWLLWWTAKRRPGDPRPEETSHYWDEDITEYNKPMPRWWIQGFYIAIAFGIGYIAWYGGLGKYAGISGWSSQQEHAREKAASDANLAETFRPYDGQPIDRLAEGFHARVVQHECDHLWGTLYPMRVRDFTRFGFTEVVAPGVAENEKN